jgi:hypothetical protein
MWCTTVLSIVCNYWHCMSGLLKYSYFVHVQVESRIWGPHCIVDVFQSYMLHPISYKLCKVLQKKSLVERKNYVLQFRVQNNI